MKILTKNKTKYDCGLIAIFNALAWCKIPKTYKQIEKIAKTCGYSPDKGIYNFQLNNLIQKLNIPAKQVKPKSLEEIQESLYLGRFFIFLYRPTGDDGGHAITSFVDHNGKIKLINSDQERMTWNEFASDIHANGMKAFHVYEIPYRGTFADDFRKRTD